MFRIGVEPVEGARSARKNGGVFEGGVRSISEAWV